MKFSASLKHDVAVSIRVNKNVDWAKVLYTAPFTDMTRNKVKSMGSSRLIWKIPPSFILCCLDLGY